MKDTGMNTQEVKGMDGFIHESAVRAKYRRITLRLIELGQTITFMESCTAGQLASLVTDTEGSSAVLRGAFVTYSNEAKIMLGVPAETIETHGVYSAETAQAMAIACRAAFAADIGVGVTGSFGNADPVNADSVPGEVYFATDTKGGRECCHCSVPAQASRLAYKLYMADVIADAVIRLLGGGNEKPEADCAAPGKII